jgi:ATP-dependent RNA helicase UAP56/SUB2
MGLDVLCQAKAGMGKTAVFVLTVLNRLSDEPAGEPSCLVLTHTRELAYQIAKEFRRFSVNFPTFKTQVIIGGENMNDQTEQLKNDKPQVVVGTPGRVLALIKRKVLETKNVKVFIIDECDKMLQELGKLKANLKI